MTLIYDVIGKRHRAAAEAGKPDIVIFYDEDREKALETMRKYNKEHGFSIDTDEGTFTIATLMLRERKPTGEVISEVPWHELFDCQGNRKRGTD